MAKFNIDKKGYNPDEVDDYINKMCLKYEDKLCEQRDRVVTLKKEVESLNLRLANYENKDEQISKALIFAVEKAEQIEINAKNVYNLEIKRINALYNRWEELLLEVEKQCPQINENGYLNSLMEDFKDSIVEVSKTGLTLNTKSIKDEIKRTSDQFIKNILNKMSYAVNSKPVEVVEPIKPKKEILSKHISQHLSTNQTQHSEKQIVKTENVAQQTKLNSTKLETDKNVSKQTPENKSYSSITSINERLKRLNLINKSTNLNVKKDESLAEKYLNSDDDMQINAYAKNFTKKKLEKNRSTSPFNFMEYPEPNETGFDLKEALNPKEDLDEIMKAFDFFDND